MIDVRPINNPEDVWNAIKGRLVDDSGELRYSGETLGIFVDDVLSGAFLIKPWSEFCYEIHGGVMPKFFGMGVSICYELGLSIFRNTPCLKIVAIIPEFNHLMRRCVQQVGMKQEGVITRSFLKWYRLHDQYIYGIEKRGMKCQ